MGRGSGKVRQAKGKLASQWVRVFCESSFYPSFPGTQREAPLHMEISFVHVNFPYKRVTSVVFSELLLCLLFLKIISSK